MPNETTLLQNVNAKQLFGPLLRCDLISKDSRLLLEQIKMPYDGL